MELDYSGLLHPQASRTGWSIASAPVRVRSSARSFNYPVGLRTALLAGAPDFSSGRNVLLASKHALLLEHRAKPQPDSVQVFPLVSAYCDSPRHIKMLKDHHQVWCIHWLLLANNEQTKAAASRINLM
jgi:hypothetical protein